MQLSHEQNMEQRSGYIPRKTLSLEVTNPYPTMEDEDAIRNSVLPFVPSNVRQHIRNTFHWTNSRGNIREDTYYVKVVPGQEIARLPVLFAQRHLGSVRPWVTVVDPRGNVNSIQITKRCGLAFITDGWWFLGRFYGLLYGGWIRMAYTQSGDFKIRVKDAFGKEVNYPPMVESVEENVEPNQGVDNNNTELELFPHERCFLHIFNKWLTIDDVMGNTMSIASNFCEAVLPKDDYEGHQFGCYLVHDIGQLGDSGICRGWAEFASFMRLEIGQLVQFGVKANDGNVIYFIP